MLTLADLPKGQHAKILPFPAHDGQHEALFRRLTQLGFHADNHVEILHEGFPKRDPLSVRVGNHSIALRRNEALLIPVEVVS
jgi:ferrous iron transport protein A